MKTSMPMSKPERTGEIRGIGGLVHKVRPFFCESCKKIQPTKTNHTFEHYDRCKNWACRKQKPSKYVGEDDKIGLKSYNVFSNDNLIVHYAKIEHKNFKVEFFGRNKGAYADSYKFVAYVDAKDQEDATKQVDESHEIKKGTEINVTEFATF